MPFFSRHTSSSESATLTIVSTSTQTIFDANRPSDRSSYPDPTYPTPFIHLLLLLGLPILWYLARYQTKRLFPQKSAPTHTLEEWEQPWQTYDWATLYGLIGIANDNKWDHTPLRFFKDIHKRWHQPNRPWMKRLLAMGVIPLYIQDGGMEQSRVNFTGFGRSEQFPYFTWPRFHQSKKRAYFEFLVPYPRESQKRMEFLQEIIQNRVQDDVVNEQVVRDNSYGVTVRFSPPDRGAIYYSIDNPPCPEERPFEVGTQSAMEPLVPFKRDEVLRKGYAQRCHTIAYFIQALDPSKVPLLRHADTILVRLEAKHYGLCEVDHFVFSIAQDVGLPVQWPEVQCREAAVEELNRCRLPVDGLRPFILSEPEEYH